VQQPLQMIAGISQLEDLLHTVNVVLAVFIQTDML
jgi:hypothetical protein